MHKAYDEQTAVLIGDALQPLAIQWVLTRTPEALVTPKALVSVVAVLTRTSGVSGLITGQVVDCWNAFGHQQGILKEP
ncbi:MAG: hypothetical protein U0003_03690 [Vampirovibrionales bacterium]